MYQTTLEQLIVLLSGAVAIAVVSYIFGLSSGYERSRKDHARDEVDKR